MADLLTTDLIQGIQAVPDQVEAVEHQPGLRKVLTDGVGIGRPHVTADSADRTATALVEPLEEGIDGFALALLSDPNDAAAFQIVDQSQIRVPLAAADFIDADGVERHPLTALQAFGNGEAHNLRHGLPVQAEIRSHLQPAQLPRHHRDGCRQRHRHPAPWLGPRDLFDFDLLAPRAADTEGMVADFQHGSAQAQVPPCPLLPRPAVRPVARQAASAAVQPPLPDPLHVSNNHVACFLDSLDIVRFHSKLFSDKCFHAHRTEGPSFRVFDKPEGYPNFRCAFDFVGDEGGTRSGNRRGWGRS